MKCLIGLTLFTLVAGSPLLSGSSVGAATTSLVTNGGFENGLAGWRPLWTRDARSGSASLEQAAVHSGRNAVRLEHRGDKDWSFEPEGRIPVSPGDAFEWSAWGRLEGSGDAVLCVSTWDGRNEATDWSFGSRSVARGLDYRQVRSRFIVPPGVVSIQPRVIGTGPVRVWLDEFSLVRSASTVRPRRDLPPSISISNRLLAVTIATGDGTLTVRDQRSGRQWLPGGGSSPVFVTDAQGGGGAAELKLVDPASGLVLKADFQLEPDAPELTLSLSGSGELPDPLRYPRPFRSEPGEFLVVPMNEGISYPVEDSTIEPMRLVAYGGHGICMGFWGVTDGERGCMGLIETADDAAIRIERVEGRLTIRPEWDPQRGELGYTRRLRYVFLDHGGHVAMCKRYRAHARQTGLVKTLSEKRQANPNVDLLIGAVNVWCWDRDTLGIVREMKAAGIERILWSNRQGPDALRALNDLGVLTSRYDIYQDVMAPTNFPHLRGVHSDWTTAAWPKDIIRRSNGDWLRGWAVKGTNGQWYSCGVICDRQALPYARERIPPELQNSPYRCRFIDTTTAAPWHECYDPAHPMTRSESRRAKMALLAYVSEENHLVTGCETGHEAAVPFLHYFEGMLSLGPYRVPDSGRDMQRLWTEVPERVAKFQLGHAYRLPLWELVYHDCVVAQWYWGDYNNKLPALWDKRDLFNVLYGTPPMFMFSRALWQKERARFVQSYSNVCQVARATGYSEMTGHRWLRPDRSVQQTTFANGMVVTVNFSEQPYRGPDGLEVRPLGFHVSGMPTRPTL